MCGVFGFIGERGKGPNLERLAKIARVTQQRGGHAFGFAWIDAGGRLRSFKQTGRIGDHLPLLAMMKDARMIVGHCRYATHGDASENINNHPFTSDGGWIVHNGVIHEYAEICVRRELRMVSDCDSEVVALLMETLPGTILERGAATMAEIGSSAVVLGLWHKPERMLVARNGNPLHYGSTAHGVYFGSLAGGLPEDRREVEDGTVGMHFLDGAGAIGVRRRQVTSYQLRVTKPGGTIAPERKPVFEMLRGCRF